MSTQTDKKKKAVPAAPHRFNRYEIKYFVPESRLPVLREALQERLSTDPLSPPGGYRIESVYFDSPDLRFYREKIEGLKFRRKLRIRRYGNGPLDPQGPCTVEIKQRVNRVTQKRRFQLGLEDAMSLCDSTGEMVGHGPNLDDLAEKVGPQNLPLLNEIAAFVSNNQLRPIVTTTYLREAYVGSDIENGLRVTFDHNVYGRDKDFFQGEGSSHNRPIIAPDTCIVELKADERVPLWCTDLMGRLGMDVIRISKYCAAVQAFNTQPSSAFGSVDRVM
ncbi:MAG: polyphosphate polymerase domain-containing protein [Corynebacterium sp.]|nr:polyphosphate polymerase domain-containing protein [Corynebacterium sp.]